MIYDYPYVAKHDSWLPVRTSKDVVVVPDAAAAAEGLLGGRRKSIFENGFMRRGSFRGKYECAEDSLAAACV